MSLNAMARPAAFNPGVSAATSASRAAASIRRAPSHTISSINDPPIEAVAGSATASRDGVNAGPAGPGSLSVTTVSTGVHSRPAVARGPYSIPSLGLLGKIRRPKPIHRFQALLTGSPSGEVDPRTTPAHRLSRRRPALHDQEVDQRTSAKRRARPSYGAEG